MVRQRRRVSSMAKYRVIKAKNPAYRRNQLLESSARRVHSMKEEPTQLRLWTSFLVYKSNHVTEMDAPYNSVRTLQPLPFSDDENSCIDYNYTHLMVLNIRIVSGNGFQYERCLTLSIRKLSLHSCFIRGPCQ